MAKVKDRSENIKKHGIRRNVRLRIRRGDVRDGSDVVALRRLSRMTQKEFALGLGISVSTLRKWEQGTRMPRGPALALLSVIATRPTILRERLAASDAA